MKEVHKSLSDKTGEEIARLVAKTAFDHKAEDLVVLDVRGLASFTD
ncbi:MAG TPA: ribosome silencing factor, partial [Deltaproteobacteria bacterium]|nr:ribosome silencing factor [Deltaproteobacteria bacterium]